MNAFRNEILARIKTKAGGNSKRGMKEVASDLVNNLGMKDSAIAELSGLSASTVARIKTLEPAESGSEYRPQSDTIERIIRACGAEINLTPVKIRKEYMNQPKEEV